MGGFLMIALVKKSVQLIFIYHKHIRMKFIVYKTFVLTISEAYGHVDDLVFHNIRIGLCCSLALT